MAPVSLCYQVPMLLASVSRAEYDITMANGLFFPVDVVPLRADLFGFRQPKLLRPTKPETRSGNRNPGLPLCRHSDRPTVNWPQVMCSALDRSSSRVPDLHRQSLFMLQCGADVDCCSKSSDTLICTGSAGQAPFFPLPSIPPDDLVPLAMTGLLTCPMDLDAGCLLSGLRPATPFAYPKSPPELPSALAHVSP